MRRRSPSRSKDQRLPSERRSAATSSLGWFSMAGGERVEVPDGIEACLTDFLHQRCFEQRRLFDGLRQRGCRLVVVGPWSHGGHRSGVVAQGSLGACSLPPGECRDGSPSPHGFPEYGSPGFHVVPGACVDKDPARVQGGRFGRAAEFACELHMVSAKQLTMEAYVVFVEDRADNAYPVAQQGCSHDRKVGCLVFVDASKPHKVAAIGGGWFFFSEPEVHGKFGAGLVG